MTMTPLKRLAIAALLLATSAHAQPLATRDARPATPAATTAETRDTSGLVAEIDRMIAYGNQYPFIRYDRNAIQWVSPDAMKTFYQALARASQQKVRVVHIGDSHVQADIYTGWVRNRLQQLFGRGGRGAVFPYAIANTHAAYDYTTQTFGNWAAARNIENSPVLPLGIHGASGYTNQVNAGFRLIFNDPATVQDSPLLRIYCRKGAQSFDLKIHCDDAPPIVVSCNADTTQPYVEALLPFIPSKLEVWLTNQGDSTRNYFELYGLTLENPANQGLLYHSVGINGAGFSAILRQQLMPQHLKALQPDLVVLDISGNEYYLGGLDAIDFELKLRSTIALIRQGAPEASILVTCSQDIYRGYQNVAACAPASRLAKRVAFQLGCAFYDYYAVSGGRYSMLKWREQDLAKRDRVHLTNTGYQVKGELFTNALLAGWKGNLMQQATLLDTADATTETAPVAAVDVENQRLLTPPPVPVARPKVTATSRMRTVYVVRRGDVLGSIAKRHRTTTAKLRAWNNLRSNIIRVGQRLVIYSGGYPVESREVSTNEDPAPNLPVPQAKTPAPAPKAKPAVTSAAGAAWHTVKSGESLWTIAQKYRTTTAKIKSLNGLRSDALRPGQKLRVK